MVAKPPITAPETSSSDYASRVRCLTADLEQAALHETQIASLERLEMQCDELLITQDKSALSLAE
jgi:hypothetical protein